MTALEHVKVGPSRLIRTGPKISIKLDARQFNRAMKQASKALSRFAAAFTASKGQQTAHLSQMHAAYRSRARRRTRRNR